MRSAKWRCNQCKAIFLFGPITAVDKQPGRTFPLCCPYCGRTSTWQSSDLTTFTKITKRVLIEEVNGKLDDRTSYPPSFFDKLDVEISRLKSVKKSYYKAFRRGK